MSEVRSGREETIPERARRALGSAWKATHPESDLDKSGYMQLVGDNLVPGTTLEMFEADLRAGDGDELRKKFKAAHSSAALAVNTFARWKTSSDELRLAGNHGFDRLALEVQCQVVPGRRKANLDLVATGTVVIGGESKLLETLSHKTAKFSRAYDCFAKEFGASPYFRLMTQLREDPGLFLYLDAAQLIKHYFGLRQSHKNTPITLLYLYWEPVNASEFALFVEHRAEVESFASIVSEDVVRFASVSYPELWRSWESQLAPEWLSDHVAALRRRYLVTI